MRTRGVQPRAKPETSVGTRDYQAFAAQWLANVLPCRRFASTLAGTDARFGADADRYSFTVVDLHHLLLAGLTGAPCFLNCATFIAESQPRDRQVTTGGILGRGDDMTANELAKEVSAKLLIGTSIDLFEPFRTFDENGPFAEVVGALQANLEAAIAVGSLPYMLIHNSIQSQHLQRLEIANRIRALKHVDAGQELSDDTLR